jgi:hypothetical protein
MDTLEEYIDKRRDQAINKIENDNKKKLLK